MQDTDIRAQYVQAVLEGRWATAEYLSPDLPEVDLEGYMKTSEGQERASCSGEIEGGR